MTLCPIVGEAKERWETNWTGRMVTSLLNEPSGSWIAVRS